MFRRHGEAREAIGYALQLDQRRQHDVHVGLARARLVDAVYGVGAEHADRDVLRDDCFALNGRVGEVDARA
jgi:hypothetical protein